MNRELVKKAYDFAKEKHRGQLRDGGQAYIVHPVRVAKLILQHKSSRNIEYLVAGALLHDTLEDTYTSYRELLDNFGEIVASMVMELTTASYVPKLEGKDIYLSHKMENMSSYALCIKLADRLDNLSELDTVSEEKKIRMLNQTKNIIDYLLEHRKLTKTQQSLVNEIVKILNENNIIGER